MERKIQFSTEEYYHVYNRGVEKRKVFLDEEDYGRFLEMLYLCNGTKPIVVRDIPRKDRFVSDVGKRIVSIGAYALMPNHFHLLIRQNEDENGITEFLRKVTTGYTMYFNKKYERVGPLFQGVFKAEHADSDEYLKYLYSYIHLNPAKIIDTAWREHVSKQVGKKLLDFVQSYRYSSFDDYLNGKRAQKVILSQKDFPDYFGSGTDLVESLTDWLEAEANT
jgi:putative transposase